MRQLFFIPPKLAKLPWGLCPQTPEVFRFGSRLMSLGPERKKPRCTQHRGCRAVRLNLEIQSRSSCASAELYPARESPLILSVATLPSIPQAHYSTFDPTIRLLLIRPQQVESAFAIAE